MQTRANQRNGVRDGVNWPLLKLRGMPDDQERRTIIDRANRMVRQSKTLRKLSDELLQEANDLRAVAKKPKTKKAGRVRR